MIGFFLLLQLVGLYLLFCLQRTANNLDRLADVAEEWLRRQLVTPTVPVAPMPTPSMPPTAAPAYLPAGFSETAPPSPSATANPAS